MRRERGGRGGEEGGRGEVEGERKEGREEVGKEVV